MKRKLSRALRGFCRSRRGAAAVLFAAALVPVAGLGTGAVLLARESLNFTQVSLANDQAALALARIRALDSQSEMISAATAKAWMDENTDLLDRTLTVTTVTPAVTEQNVSVVSRWRSRPSVESAVGRLFSRMKNLEVESRVGFYASDVEVVFTIDNSADSAGGQAVAQGMSKVLDKLFDGKSSDEKIHFSMFAVSTHVNLGTKYADAISRESRRLQGPDDPFWDDEADDRTRYEHQKEILDGISTALADDLLSPKGPGVADDAAVVGRLPFEDVESYLETLDRYPTSEDDKLPLYVCDGRRLPGEENSVLPPIQFFRDGDRNINRIVWPSDTTYDAKDYVMVPDSYWNEEDGSSRRYEQFNANDTSSWYGLRFQSLGDLEDGVINFPMDGPVMPVLADSHDVAEIVEHSRKSMNSMEGVIDEHFMWAYRLLSPAWAPLWSTDGSYPAQYHSGTQKHAWVNVGRDTGGGHTDGILDNESILPRLLEKFAENGVVLHFILDDTPEGPRADIEDAVKEYGEDLGWEIIDLYDGQGSSDLFERITEQMERPSNFICLVPTDGSEVQHGSGSGSASEGES